MRTTGLWSLLSGAALAQPQPPTDLRHTLQGDAVIDIIAVVCLVILGLVLGVIGLRATLRG